jgi:hypothetical protein
MHLPARVLVPLLLIVAAACARAPRWDIGDSFRARDFMVADALDDHDGARDLGFDLSLAPDLPPPEKLRPCCAFGTQMKVRMGFLPVPLVALGNIVGADDLGPHRYDNGILTVDSSDHRGWIDTEKNGVAYTCRGGFIDIAHVRDNADLTVAVLAQVVRAMESGGTIELPDQGARLRIRVRPVKRENLERYGHVDLALAGAQWLTFQVSIWHEIATWYGFAAIKMWPERVSAFSPEDLYSNLLGIKLAAGVVHNKGAQSEIGFNRNMDAWMQRALARLVAVPKASGEAAMWSVDGVWWDSQARLPDWKFVRRRNMDIDADIRPWLIEEAQDPSDSKAVLEECEDSPPPLVLQNRDGFEGLAFRDALTLEIEVGDLMAERFPFPDPGSRRITQEDFPGIIAAIREENEAEFGAGADRPERNSAIDLERPNSSAPRP